MSIHDPSATTAAQVKPNEFPTLAFVLKNYRSFNARATRDALLAYWRRIESGGRMFWAIAGANLV